MKKGFTLIELLVVIAIIALLSTLSIIALNSARVKSRDARRLSDIRQIRTALEMYFDQNSKYPETDGWIIIGGVNADFDCLSSNGLGVKPCTSTVYLETIPGDPRGSDTPYYYDCDSVGATYQLSYHLEGTNQSYTATPATAGY